MNSLPEPKRHDLSLAEAISLLAWGRMFSTNDFLIADGYSENCKSLSKERERLRLLEERFSELHLKSAVAPHESITPADDSPLENGDAWRTNHIFDKAIAGKDTENAEIFNYMNALRAIYGNIENIEEIASLWQECNKAVQRYEAAVRAAETLIPQMEGLEGGKRYGSSNFLSGNLTRATHHLWDAIAGKAVVMYAKPHRDASVWEEVPATWFWGDSKPECYLESACVQRSNSSNSAPGETKCWFDVRFIRPEIDTLYKQLTEGLIQGPGTKSPEKIVDGLNPSRRGGRPPKYDWDAFWVEVVRIAAMEDLPQRLDGLGNDTAKLTTIMKQWCVDTWGGEPDDSAIRRKLSKIPLTWSGSEN